MSIEQSAVNADLLLETLHGQLGKTVGGGNAITEARPSLSATPLVDREGKQKFRCIAHSSCASGPIYSYYIDEEGRVPGFNEAYPNAPSWVKRVVQFVCSPSDVRVRREPPDIAPRRTWRG